MENPPHGENLTFWVLVSFKRFNLLFLKLLCLYDTYIQSYALSKLIKNKEKHNKFLVSGRDLACQQQVSLALTKTPPIHYYKVVDSAFSNYAG